MSETSNRLPLAEGMDWDPGHNPWLIAISVTLATFMEVLDTTIVNVALPHIAGNLSASVDESTWVLTSYLVSNAIVLPLSGWLSSVFGRKRFYMSCVVLFTVSSFLCGLAPSLGWLVCFRIMQGLGGGGLQPSEQAILVDTFPRNKRGMGMAVYGIAVVCAPILGPTLGGWITDNYSWRWVFFINIPVGMLSVLLTSQLVKDPPYLKKQRGLNGRRIDFMGLGLIALGLGALQIVLDKGEREDWFASNFIRIFSVLAVTGMVAAVVWELRQKDPLVDLRLLKNRSFAVATFLMFTLGFVLFGSTVLLPLLLQTLLGYSATDSGMVLSPGGIVTFAMMPIIGVLVSHVDARYLIALGLAIVCASLYVMSGFNLQMDYRYAVESRMIMGLGLAFLFVPINTAAYSVLPKGKNNNAAGLINLARNLGGSCGIALVATLLARRAQFHQYRLVEHLTPYDWAYRTTTHGIVHRLQEQGMNAWQAAQAAPQIIYGQMMRQATMLAYLDAFWLLMIGFGLMIPLVFLMKKTHIQKGEMAAH